MRVLFTGRGNGGSWKIRGEQLGNAVGATVKPNAIKLKADLCVIVKRDVPRDRSVPVVFDVVDSWPQPHGNEWAYPQCMQWLRGQIAAIRPIGIVAATGVMADDCAEFGVPVLRLPHHARPGQAINSIRDRVKVVGYEGGVRYLGKWQAVLEKECTKRGWRFVTNPPQLADLDIVVALRQATGYAARNWKSNVKAANAQATGTPFICQRSSGYVETSTGGECLADTEAELTAALDILTDIQARRTAHEMLRTGTITLESVAATYRSWLESLWKS